MYFHRNQKEYKGKPHEYGHRVGHTESVGINSVSVLSWLLRKGPL